MTNLPALFETFNMTFDDGGTAKAVRIPKDGDLHEALRVLEIATPVPVIFVSGGASSMTEDDRKTTYRMIETVVQFADERGAIIVDGGTEAGVMEMVGDVHKKDGYQFPLIGVSPLGKVSFPGYENPDAEAKLDDHHTHFILVDGEKWGDETESIIKLTNALCEDNTVPSVGILINGGRIALHEIYLASTQENKLSIIVLEGTGRAADEVSTAFREGSSNRAILQAILSGGDIQLVATREGKEALRKKLNARFDRAKA